ncbi:MAG: prepilin-type N-terminal cleavage/methylation domain-containing protein [Defluviitaleaceae bacterium]|nr:prepilin-type N-terminal cleavage/methylation domain-containing protein [Defluviitaleaceae bacterium]
MHVPSKTKSGLTLLELVIAISVLAIAAAALVMLFVSGQAARQRAHLRNLALIEARSQLERLSGGRQWLDDLQRVEHPDGAAAFASYTGFRFHNWGDTVNYGHYPLHSIWAPFTINDFWDFPAMASSCGSFDVRLRRLYWTTVDPTAGGIAKCNQHPDPPDIGTIANYQPNGDDFDISPLGANERVAAVKFEAIISERGAVDDDGAILVYSLILDVSP